MESSETDEFQINDYLKARNTLLRNYQIKLIKEAKERNSIIYLPTGAGKTLVAIHVLCSRTKDIIKPISEGGKIAFFLATTKLMSAQLARVLKIHTNFKVAFFNGDMNVDSWKREKWISIFEKYQVIAVTAEICKQILELEFIKPSNVTMIVFDECHHAVLEHPYKLILEIIAKSDSDKPLLLGLSSVLLNSSPKSDKILSMIHSLECSFEGKILSESELEEIMTVTAKAVEKTVVYKKPDFSSSESFLKLYDDCLVMLNNLALNLNSVIPKEGKPFKSKDKLKRIKNGIVQSKLHLEELGMFAGSLSALFFTVLFDKYSLTTENVIEKEILIYVKTELNKIRRALLKAMGYEESLSTILRFSSPKVQRLIYLLLENKEFNGNNNSTMIFVHQRMTAVVLTFLLKRLSLTDPKFNFLKADYIVGSAHMNKQTVFCMKSEEIIKEFTCQSLSVLVTTNVLEEGIDVPSCNTVISFDFPQSYSSYFQSKGRARDKKSLYFVFVEEGEIQMKEDTLQHYNEIGKLIMKTICEDSEIMDDDDEEQEKESGSESTVEKICFPGNSRVLTVNGITAIKAVFRYCSKLPQDSFSFLSPVTWYTIDRINHTKKGFLLLPNNCPLRDIVEGEWKKSKKEARRSCFLITVKKLFDLGELDDDLNMKPFQLTQNKFSYISPQWNKIKSNASLFQSGNTSRQTYKIKFAESLSNCLVRPGVKAYLHVIDFTVAFDKPELQRKITIYDILRSPATFAILSVKKLKKICQFPLFLDLGQMNCDLLVNYDEIVLNKLEINEIKLCHFALFQKVIKVIKNSQIFDNSNKGHSFFIVPMKKNEGGRYTLNWDLIRLDFCKYSNSALVRYNPSSNFSRERHSETYERDGAMANEGTTNFLVPEKCMWGEFRGEQFIKKPKFEITETAYNHFIIAPNYRSVDPPQCYIVCKVCHDMSPLTPFPRDNYETYLQYYRDKYFIQITNPKQPLLKVSAMYTCANFSKPKSRKPKRTKEKFKEYEEHLVPELCDVIPFDRLYWAKALLLPSVLNRINHVYCVEEFRRRIVVETGLGLSDLPDGTDWKPLEVDGIVFSEEPENEVGSTFQSYTNSQEEASLPLSKLKDKTKTTNKICLDPERHIYEIGLCDLEFYVKEEMESDENENFVQIEELLNSPKKKFTLKDIKVPALKVLTGDKNPLGPDLAQMIQVCTAKSARDIVDYERLETLGDSFLKFGATFYLFKNHSENEGVLTAVKGKIIGNLHLMLCGKEKRIQDVINVIDFVPLSDWNPPLLCVPENLVDEIISNNVDPAVLYRFEIPFEEQFSGVLSEATLEKNREIIRSYDQCWDAPVNSLLSYKMIKSKTISDCVEAFLGIYLTTLGLFGAFEMLLWFEILPKPKGSYSELIEKPIENTLLSPADDALVMSLLNQVFYSDLEDFLGYRFKNKALLLESLTHPSYIKNVVTHCYQRLELLGDAVLDFLITVYIYENCGYLTSGQITDVRSSLVNNITFACLVVRYELYKYMLFMSSPLSKTIGHFVSFQISRDHVVDDNVLILLDEKDCMIAESIQVPKALSDLFESLAGAIFLDSGNSLETVWNIYYRLMKEEIDKFTKTIPKTPVRLLQEICSDKIYYEVAVCQDAIKVLCCAFYEDQEIKAYGFGPNKKEGKRSAAKIVLNKILEMKK